MSARQRPPTDELKTSIYDSQRPRAKSATKKGFESGEIPTKVDRPQTLELETPTDIDPPRNRANERSEPIRVISMKTPGEGAADKKREAKQHKPAIRALSDVLPRHATPPQGMGRLAPPADPRQARARKLRDGLIWGSVLVIISCVVMLAVWFLAGN